MNEDHVGAMVHYGRTAHIPLPEGSIPVMAGVDTEGLHLRVGARVVRFEFESRTARGSRSAKLWWLWRAATDRQGIGAKFDPDPTEARALIALAEEEAARGSKDFLMPKAIH